MYLNELSVYFPVKFTCIYSELKLNNIFSKKITRLISTKLYRMVTTFLVTINIYYEFKGLFVLKIYTLFYSVQLGAIAMQTRQIINPEICK